MKKRFLNILAILVVGLVLTGCSTFKSFTFDVETGDKVSIRLDTSNGYDLTGKVPFSVLDGDKILSTGTFIKGDFYDKYVQAANTQGKVITEDDDKNIEYVFYSYQDKEWNYVIKIKNSNTAILLGNQISEKDAKKVFKLLTFKLEN